MKNLVFIVIFIFSLTSCVTSYNANYNETGGYVVGSISVKDVSPKFDNYKIFYQSIEKEPNVFNAPILFNASTTESFFTRQFSSADFSSNGEAVHCFSKKLKPGKYYIVAFSPVDNTADTPMGMIVNTFSNSIGKKEIYEYYYPFEVKENEITYIGEFYYDSKKEYNYKIYDKFERDMKEVDKKYPELRKYKAYKSSFKYLKHH